MINVLMKHPRDETLNSQKSNDIYDVISGCASKINNFIKLGVLIFITDVSFITNLIFVRERLCVDDVNFLNYY